MENKNKKMFETEFYALSIMTGDIQKYLGDYIIAPSIDKAVQILRDAENDYLQVNGKWKYIEEADDADFNYEVSIEKVEEIIDEELENASKAISFIKDLEYDDFIDYLESLSLYELQNLLINLGKNKKDLKLKGIIATHIKLNHKEDGNKED